MHYELCIMNCALFFGRSGYRRRAFRSIFAPLNFPSLKKNEVHSPKSEVRASQRMPLQSLTQPPIIKIKPQNLKNSKF